MGEGRHKFKAPLARAQAWQTLEKRVSDRRKRTLVDCVWDGIECLRLKSQTPFGRFEKERREHAPTLDDSTARRLQRIAGDYIFANTQKTYSSKELRTGALDFTHEIFSQTAIEEFVAEKNIESTSQLLRMAESLASDTRKLPDAPRPTKTATQQSTSFEKVESKLLEVRKLAATLPSLEKQALFEALKNLCWELESEFKAADSSSPLTADLGNLLPEGIA